MMLIFTVATVMSGALLYGLGVCRWGSYFRFVPYPVIGGFFGRDEIHYAKLSTTSDA
jgi:MFS superfamily sulfate permease-like transporter